MAEAVTVDAASIDDDSLLVWGPVSVEAVSDDDKLITMQAIEDSLDRLLRRGRGAVLHKDQIVGELHQLAAADPGDTPNGRSRQLVEHLVAEHGGLPTAIMEVTPPIAEAFPHLHDHVGDEVFFAAMEVWGDGALGEMVQEAILEGDLDSYSISGLPEQSETIRHCDAEGCRAVERVDAMDASAITLGSRSETAHPLSGRTRNPGAAFMLVQQLDAESFWAHRCPETVIEQCACGGDPKTGCCVEQSGQHSAKMKRCINKVSEDEDEGAAIAICRDTLDEAVTYGDDEDEDETEEADVTSTTGGVMNKKVSGDEDDEEEPAEQQTPEGVPDNAISISSPDEAPEGARVIEGPRGGLYAVPSGDGGEDEGREESDNIVTTETGEVDLGTVSDEALGDFEDHLLEVLSDDEDPDTAFEMDADERQELLSNLAAVHDEQSRREDEEGGGGDGEEPTDGGSREERFSALSDEERLEIADAVNAEAIEVATEYVEGRTAEGNERMREAFGNADPMPLDDFADIMSDTLREDGFEVSSGDVADIVRGEGEAPDGGGEDDMSEGATEEQLEQLVAWAEQSRFEREQPHLAELVEWARASADDRNGDEPHAPMHQTASQEATTMADDEDEDRDDEEPEEQQTIGSQAAVGEILMELKNRMESIEQDVAAIKGQEPMPEDEDDVEDDVDVDDDEPTEEQDDDAEDVTDPDDADDVGDEDEGGIEEQDDDAEDVTDPDDADDVGDEVEELVQREVEKRLQPVQQALGIDPSDLPEGLRSAETPKPVEQARPGQQSDEEFVEQLQQAADEGDHIGVGLLLQDAAYGGDEE